MSEECLQMIKRTFVNNVRRMSEEHLQMTSSCVSEECQKNVQMMSETFANNLFKNNVIAHTVIHVIAHAIMQMNYMCMFVFVN